MNVPWRKRAVGALLLLLNLAFFAPAFFSLARETVQHEQLRHAVLILLFATAALLMEDRAQFKIKITADRRFYLLLGLAFCLMFGSFFFVPVFFKALAFSIAWMAWLGFLWGPESRRLGTALALAFMFFIGAAHAFEVMDWPLRQMAGQHSAWVLNHFGLDSNLFLNTANGPKLILSLDQHSFEVASECNGYGLICSSGLVALLLTAYHRSAWPDKWLGVVLALFLGSLFNTLRILFIVLLAPRVGIPYQVLHEGLGTLFFWGCLVLVWFVVGGFPQKSERSQLVSPLPDSKGNAA